MSFLLTYYISEEIFYEANAVKLIPNLLLILFISLTELVFAQKKEDSLIKVNEKISVSAESNQRNNRGIQQNINLSFVHYYSDFFRSNEMGSHMNLGYGIKPKSKHLEIMASAFFTETRIEEDSRFYDQYNDKWVLFSTLGVGYCIAVPYHKALMELGMATGPQLMTIFDVKTVYGIFTSINIRIYLPGFKSNPNLKLGIYAEFKDHIYSLFGSDYLWDEYLKSKKEHVSRDGVFLLGFIMGFGDFN